MNIYLNSKLLLFGIRLWRMSILLLLRIFLRWGPMTRRSTRLMNTSWWAWTNRSRRTVTFSILARSFPTNMLVISTRGSHSTTSTWRSKVIFIDTISTMWDHTWTWWWILLSHLLCLVIVVLAATLSVWIVYEFYIFNIHFRWFVQGKLWRMTLTFRITNPFTRWNWWWILVLLHIILMWSPHWAVCYWSSILLRMLLVNWRLLLTVHTRAWRSLICWSTSWSTSRTNYSASILDIRLTCNHLAACSLHSVMHQLFRMLLCLCHLVGLM